MDIVMFVLVVGGVFAGRAHNETPYDPFPTLAACQEAEDGWIAEQQARAKATKTLSIFEAGCLEMNIPIPEHPPTDKPASAGRKGV